MASSINVKIAPLPRGDYSSSATYAKLDVVSYNGSSYMAIKAVPTGTAPTNTTYWQLLAEKPTIGGGSITTNMLADGAVTDAKLAQSGGVLEEVAELKSVLVDEIESKSDVPLTWVSATGYWNANKGFSTYEGVTTATIDVNQGEVYYLTTRNYYNASLAVFYSGNDVHSGWVSAVYVGSGTTAQTDLKIAVPTGAEHMLIQRIYGYATSLKKETTTYVNILSDDVEEIKEATTVLSGEEVSLTYVSQAGYYNKNGTMATYESVTGATVSVQTGEQYLLNSRNYYDACIALLFDSNNTIVDKIWIANNTNQQKDILITVPENAVSLLVQRVYNYVPTTLRKVTGISIKPVKSVLNGKRVTLIGDSITERNATAMTNWALYLDDWCGAIIQNLGASGTGFIAGGANPYSNRISRISNPDIIGVALSFNDMSNTIEDLTTAAESFFDDLIEEYPTIPIICYVQSPWSAYHYGVTASDNWVNAMRDICQSRGIPFYDDMYKGSALKPWLAENRAVYYINDGEGSTGAEDWVHPNSEGHKVIARKLYQKFAINLVTTGLDYLNI